MSSTGELRASNLTHSKPLRRNAAVIDLATDECIGYLSEEYLNKRARPGLDFHALGKKWKIIHITPEESILVLQFRKTLSPTSDPTPSPKTRTNQADNVLTLESCKNYLTLHSPLGSEVNSALSMIFDAILTEEDLVRAIYIDDSRILIQTPTNLTPEEVKSTLEQAFHLNPSEIDQHLEQALDARFPTLTDEWGMPSDSLDTAENQAKLRREFASKLFPKQIKQLYRSIASGRIEVRKYFSQLGPTQLARKIIDEASEKNSAETKQLIDGNVPQWRSKIESKPLNLVCFSCASAQALRRIAAIEQSPTCSVCGSGLLVAVPVPSTSRLSTILAKKKAHKSLNPLETKQLVEARRCADLALSYGKRGLIALSVDGVGPETAARILARMHTEERAFYMELLEAKLHFLTTREYWR